MTRNRFVLNRARGFESHHLRQQKAPAQAGAFFAVAKLWIDGYLLPERRLRYNAEKRASI